jgi:DNA transformation protein and related proteins
MNEIDIYLPSHRKRGLDYDPGMPAQADFAAYCAELLAPLGEVRSKRMFGGYGLYVDGVFIAIVAGDTLSMKVDEQTRDRFAAAGGRQFEYLRQGRSQHAAYWAAPAEAMESAAAMLPWGRLALDAALRARGRQRRRH